MTDPSQPMAPSSAHPTRSRAIETIALAAARLLDDGQTSERTIVATERLGRALGLSIRVLPRWDELAVHVEGTPFAYIVPAAPLAVHMGRVLATMTIIDQVCDGTLPIEAGDP